MCIKLVCILKLPIFNFQAVSSPRFCAHTKNSFNYYYIFNKLSLSCAFFLFIFDTNLCFFIKTLQFLQKDSKKQSRNRNKIAWRQAWASEIRKRQKSRCHKSKHFVFSRVRSKTFDARVYDVIVQSRNDARADDVSGKTLAGSVLLIRG